MTRKWCRSCAHPTTSGLGVHGVAGGVVEHARPLVGAGAVAAEVRRVTRDASPRFARPMAADVCLDDDALTPPAARPGRPGGRRARAPGKAFEPARELSPHARPAPAAHLSDPVGIDLRRRVVLRMSRHGSPPLAQDPSPFASAALPHRSRDHRSAATRVRTSTCHNTAPFLFSCLPSFLLLFCSARPKSVQPDSH
jgi:hypothetical protein